MKANEFYDKHDNLPWLRERTILLVRSGSRAYGTNTPTSDEDFKGIAIPPRSYLFGFAQKFEQAESKDPDMVIYELQKFMSLAAQCNPNIIEMLWTDPADHVRLTALGEQLITHRDLFLSKKAKFTFSGYAISQLRRINTHHRWYGDDAPDHEPTRAEFGLPAETLVPQDQLAAAQAEVQKQLDSWNEDFAPDDVSEATKIDIKAKVEAYLVALKVAQDDRWQAAARTVGLNENFILLMQQERRYTGARREWEQYQTWLKTRNKDRAALEAKHGYDTKHGMHLVRLMKMCREILETGKVVVKRPDAEELLAIRNGAWDYDQLIAWAAEQDAAMDALYKTSTLRHAPDRKALDELCVRLVEAVP